MADTTQGGFTTGSDTRKVIKNATKDPTMSGNTTKTIMSSDELRSKDRKLDVHLGKTKTATPKNNNVTVPQTTTAPTNTPVSTGANVPMTQQTGGNNIGLNGISVPVAGQNTAPQMSQDAFVNTNGRAADLATLNVLDVDGMLEDLFIDVGEGLQNGKLSTTPVSKIKERYNELGLMDDKVVTDLVSDIAKMHQKGLTMDLNATEKLKSLYPELAGVERGFYSSNPNMYQAGGMKEVMNANTPFNLNKYGTMGTVAETVINPLGQGFTALDAATQTIGQVDDNTDKLLGFIDIKSTPELKKALASLTDEDIQKYYQRYLNAVEENPTLSQAWTRRVPGDTVVEQLWNMVSGNTFIDKDAGFRDWLIDQVNLETNGWQGEFWGAANELKGMSGPNIAKMYANLPASTLKTVTAIGNAVTNPVDTAGGLYTLGADLVKNINEKGWGKGFSDSIIGQRYGSWEALGNAMEQDPVGVSSDILMLGQGGASAAGKLGALTKWGATGARIATHMMGAEKMSKGLTRVINRLDKMAKASKEVSKVSGTASNLGVDQFLHGWTTPKGKKIPGLINGLEEWAKSSNSLAAKGAKYLAEHTTAKPAVETAKALLHPTKTLAGKLTGTSTPESKLFQAASPNINKLTKGVDYKNKKANMDTATQAIVDAGYTPKTVAEWAQAHVDTLNKLWDEFTAKVKGKADVEVDASRVVQKAEAYIAEIGEDLAENQRSDLKALKNEVSRIKKRGKINMKSLENLKEMFNAETRNKTNTAKGEIYTRGLKKLSEAIGDIQNEILSKSPDEVKALKKKIGALLDTKEDVIKANVKQQKRKESGGLVENYGRLSGIGDIIGGTLSIPVKGGEGVAQAAKGLGKLILGKALGKAKDVDFLTEQGFKGLQKKSGKTADNTKSLKKKEITKGSDLDALYNLKIAKDELKKKLDKGQISKDEYKRRVDDIDYDISQLKARGAKGDVEYELKSEEGKALEKKYGEEMMEKKLGFRKETEEAIKAEMKRAEENGETVRGWTKVKQKLYALSKNPTSTTAQHEFFHAVFDVVDPTTRRYLLDEAKKIMKENGMSDANAEEWLAESFAIYAKRKDIKLGVLERRKGIQGIKDRIGDFFQRVYEWIQNYNGDRRAINKIFNTILDNKWNLDSNGGLDLSYLLGNKALAKKRELGNAKGGVKFKKDTGAIKYKTDVNGKSVDIDTKATSPDQLIEKNAEGLSVMKSFISEKQADKALNVSKALLTKDGDAYLWTHTNKYDATPFTAFENAKDSKYKEFTNNEIAWFTNSKEMSNSYASEETKLADTKAPRTDAEFKDYLKKLGKKDEGKSYTNEVEFNIKKGDDGYYVERLDKWDNTYDDEGFRDYAAFYGGMTRGAYDVLEKAMGGLDNMMDAFKQRMDRNNYKNVVVERKNGKIHVHTELPSKESEVYKDKQGLYAGMYAERQGFDKYHYQGILQDMKNPLVVDLGKYAKGEIRFGEKVEGQGRFWSDLGTAYDFIKKNTDADIDTVAKTIKDEFKKAVDNEDKIYDGNLMNAFQNERLPKVMEWKRLEKEGDYVEARKWSDEAGLISSAEHKIANLRYGIVEKLTPEEAKVQIGDKTVREIYNKSKKAYEKYKDIYDLWKEQEQTYRQDYPIGGGLVSDKYTRHTRNNFINYLKNKGIDEGAASMILHDTPLRLDKGWLASYDLAEMLKNKKLQTNDYVFYALRKGGYDGVIFKDIVDYGHLTEERKGGDVVAAFNSKQFKAWDNANPTDSKYISYKKDVGLKAKLPDTDNDGRKLSEAQRKFFAGTKVVDKDGNLLRVYHGTRGGDFTVFRKGNSWSNNLAKVGYWFTPNKEGALKFAEGSWGGDAKPRAEEVYLDIKNPKVYEPSKFNLLKNEERNAKIDEQRKVYNQKADKADGLDYTHAGGFFHDEFDHPYYDRAIFEYLKRSWDNDRKYDGKYGKYNPEEYRALADEWNRNRNANLDYDKILKDFEEYTKAKLDEEKEYSKLLDIKHNDPYDDFMYDIYKIDSNYDNKWTKDDLNRALNDYDSPNKFVDKLKSEGYDGIIIKGTEYDGEVIGGGARNDQYVAFDSNQIKRITNENPTKNDDIRFKKDTNSDGKKLSEGQMEYFKDSKVRDAQGRLTPVYHFTADDFNTVDFKKGNQNLFWFTSDGTASDRAQGVRPGMQRKRKDMYVDIKNPAGWEEYNKFGTDELKYRGYDGVILKNKDGSFEGFIFDKENQVKYTDNLNPTSSKDMRFKKDMGLKAKDQTQTPEFKKWFKGSKVVDKEGKPLEVYHGSRHAGFTEFKPVNSLEDGLYFFSDKRHIASYFGGGDELWSDKGLVAEFNKAKSKGVDAVKKFGVRYLNTPHEIEVTVNHITPKEARQFGVEPGYVYMLDDGQVAGAIRRDGKHVLKEKLSQEEIDKAIIDRIEKDVGYAEGGDRAKSRVYASYLDIKNPLEVDAKGEKFSRVVNPLDGKKYHVADIAYIAKEKGYDGVIIKNVSESPERNLMGTDYIVWKSNQIKSATDNIGTFDKNNPDIRYKRGYHGSSAKFNKFDSSHMGEGEGAQVHGWGHYIASDKETAKRYSDMKGADIEYKGKKLDGYVDYRTMGIEDRVVNEVYQKLNNGKSFDQTISELKKEHEGWINYYNNKLNETDEHGFGTMDEGLRKEREGELKREKAELKFIDTLKAEDFRNNKGRHLYNVEIPDPVKRDTPTGSNYLEEEGKITRPQLDKIVKALESYKQEKEVEKGADLPFSKEVTQGLATARQRYAMRQLKEWGLSGEETYKALSTVLGGDKQASKFLESLGYDGIHYYGGRDGEAYVLFNDDAPQIQNHIKYKKDTSGLAKKSNGLQRKATYNVPQQSKTKIGNGISKMRNILKNAGISVNNHTKDGPLKNAVKMITEMNKEKDKFKGTPNFNAMVQGREDGIMGILDAIDKGYNNENLHYKWFYDPKGNGGNTNSKNHPTVLIWEGDFNNALQTYKDFQNGLIKEDDLKLWAQHMDINSNTKGSIDKFRNPKGKLEVTPLRPRKRKRSK